MTPPSAGGGAGHRKPPLNGTKTHPLTVHAIATLRSLDRADCPAQEINPGLVDRLMRDELVEPYTGPSPYRTRKGAVVWLSITPAGRAALATATDDRGHSLVQDRKE